MHDVDNGSEVEPEYSRGTLVKADLKNVDRAEAIITKRCRLGRINNHRLVPSLQ